MSTYEINVSAIPNQIINTVLNDQNCTIHIYQRGDFLYLDLSVGDEDLMLGRICLSQIQMQVKNFTGWLLWNDEQGNGGTPYYEDLGTRYKLYYVLQESD